MPIMFSTRSDLRNNMADYCCLVLVKQKCLSPLFFALKSTHFRESSPQSDEISTGLYSAANWANRGLTVSMLLLKQSYRDGLHLLNLAKYSLDCGVLNPNEKSPHCRELKICSNLF